MRANVIRPGQERGQHAQHDHHDNDRFGSVFRHARGIWSRIDRPSTNIFESAVCIVFRMFRVLVIGIGFRQFDYDYE